MTRRRSSGLGLGLVLLACVSLLACAGSDTHAASAPLDPPPVPAPRSPVDFFRELLAMPEPERRLALTNRPEEVRQRLLAKVTEYELMPPDLRNVRLRATELRWYLVPLMKLPPAQRPALAVTVPAELRTLVAERLQRWDLLPPLAQQELLENELALDYFTQAQAPSEEQRTRLLEKLPPVQRQKLEADIKRWEALSPAEQRRLFEGVRQYFELTPREQEETLGTLPSAERQQMEETLRAFGQLSHDQRVQCIRSFAKFAGMNAAERLQFLKNAERWSAMSRSERQAWRDLVHKLPEMPPLPPGFGSEPPPPLPPLRITKPPSVATNGG